MERVYTGAGTTSINFDIALPDHGEVEEEEASEDERIKERELQDLLTNAFDDLVDEDDENGSSFLRSEGSLQSSRSFHNSDERYTPRQEAENDAAPDRRVNTKNKQQASTIEEVNENDWEGRYYIDNWIESEQKSAISNQHEKAGEDQQCDNLLAYLPCNNDARDRLEYKPQVGSVVGTQNEGAGGDSSDKIRIQHLEVLYLARGREVEKLQQDLHVLKNDWATEIAALRQQLRETEEERADYAVSLEECQKALDDANDVGAKLEGELRAISMNYGAVDDSRNEILAKLQSAEATIEGLHCQLTELQKSESVGRARENHATAVNNLQERHRSEINQLNKDISDIQEKLLDRDEEVNNLRARLDRVSRECEEVKVEKGETVNRLIAALEASQEKYKKLLKSGESTAMSSDLKVSLEQLKVELTAANQELNLYRSASRLGIGAKMNDEGPASPNVVHDNLISSLKSEVERSLASLSAKNDQMKKIQAEFQASASQVKLLREQVDTREEALQEYQVKIKELTAELNNLKTSANASSSTNAKDISQLKREKKSLEKELQESKSQINELISSRKQTNELVQQLRKELSRLEEERIIAVEECREACLKLQSDSLEAERNRAVQVSKEAEKQHQAQMIKLTRELAEVKTLYVAVCQEKDSIEQHLKSEWEAEKKRVKLHRSDLLSLTMHTDKTDILKESWTEDKQLELIIAKGEFEKQQQGDAAKINNSSMAKEVTNEVSKQITDRIKQAKTKWEKEQEIHVEERALAKAKELLQGYLNGKLFDNSEVMIDEYLEQIKELEKRVRETEELYRKHLTELEANKEKQKMRELKEQEERLRLRHETIMRDSVVALKTKFEQEKQLLRAELRNGAKEEALGKLLKSAEDRVKDMSAAVHSQREEVVKELRAQAEEDKKKLGIELKLEADKELQMKLESLREIKELEKTLALAEQEERLCKELDQFLSSQKNRFLTALQTMQESHSKEKADIHGNYDVIISRLKSECREQQENRDIDQQRVNEENKNKFEEERNFLFKQIDELKAKCATLENEKLSLSTKAQLELKYTKSELEECRLKLEQNECDWGTRQEELVTAPLRKEIATMRARVNAAEDVAAQLHLQLEAETIEMKKLNDKYGSLKEKVKKYHRYVHGKEREFAESLTKMTSEHKSALERISKVRGDVAEVVESRLGELYNLMLTKDSTDNGSSSNRRPQTPNKILNNKSFFPERLKADEVEGEELKKEFVKSIEHLHADVLKFLNRCGQEAVDRIQDEVAKASWVLSEQLRGVNNQLVEVPSSTSKQTSVYEGSRSGTVTPEPATNGSSGRGTMVGNSAGSASEGAAEQFRTNRPVHTNKPMKFWSSTPFQPFSAHFGDTSKTSLTVNGSQARKYDDTDVWPVSFKASSSQRPHTAKVVQREEAEGDEDEENDESRLAKLKSLTEQILIRSRSVSASNDKEEEEKQKSNKNQFLTFSSDLSTLKNEFWKSVNGNSNNI